MIIQVLLNNEKGMTRMMNWINNVLQTVYSDAYKYESDYYDNFIAILIILDTMIDLISRTNEFITRREVFNEYK